MKAHGLDHATLTVSDIRRSKNFYEQLFGTKLASDTNQSFNLLSVGIPCWFIQWGDPPAKDRFNEKRVGLDHIAFKLHTLKELNAMILQLKKIGVKTAGLEKFLNKYPYVAFRDPDNIQIEFFINS